MSTIKTRGMIKKQKENKENKYDSIVFNSNNIYPRQISERPSHFKTCPCGGGQSCIVDRRWVGDYIYEDNIFKNMNIPLRINCVQLMTEIQKNVLKKSLKYNENT